MAGKGAREVLYVAQAVRALDSPWDFHQSTCAKAVPCRWLGPSPVLENHTTTATTTSESRALPPSREASVMGEQIRAAWGVNLPSSGYFLPKGRHI